MLFVSAPNYSPFCFFSGKKLPPDVDPLGVFANDEIDLVIFKLPDIF
jgi:hypothetical protein